MNWKDLAPAIGIGRQAIIGREMLVELREDSQ
jgi:hypothetical protein